MKKKVDPSWKSLLIWIGVIILVVWAFSSFGQRRAGRVSDEYVVDSSDYVNGLSLIESIPASEVDSEEVAGLVLMREEEKLARDVYLTLGEIWGQNIFSNIASSEQTHTDAVKVLLDRYEIEDPVKDDSVGIFNSSEMAELYSELVSKGSESLLDALIVGALIEDLDINDLEGLMITNNEDIRITYGNLQKGSRNHLRAYVRQIEINGGSYSPSYISEEEYNAIVSTAQEKGRLSN